MSELLARPRGCLSLADRKQQCGRVDRSAGDDNHVRRIGLEPAVAFHDYALHLAARRICFQAVHQRIRQERDVGILDGFIDAHNLRVGLRANQASKTVAGVAANAAALVRILFVEHDADRNVEGLQSRAREIIG